MRAATHLTEKNNPFVLPGIVIRTTPTSRFPLTQVRLQRWSNKAWHPFGDAPRSAALARPANRDVAAR